MVALSSMFHSATKTERTQPAKEIFMVLRQVDFCPLWETPTFTSVLNDTPKLRKSTAE